MAVLAAASGLVVMTALLVLLLGAALLSCSRRGRSLTAVEFLAYSLGSGVLGLAVIGVAVVSVSWHYQYNAWGLLALAVLFSLFQWRRAAVLSRMFGMQAGIDAGKSRCTAGAWLLMALVPMAITFMPVSMPSDLPDGAYVIKSDRVHVRIQRMLGDFPADNYIPFAAGEYLLRDISFAEQRPLMPGQEMANRPILMSLAAVPVRAALDGPARITGELSTFRYVGRQWPDVAQFGDDASYRQFLAVALVLNATLLVGAALLLAQFGLKGGYWVAGLLVLASSPYFIGQTLFAWPKSLAAFFLVLSAHTLLVRERTWVAGAWAVLAYWSHPYAVVFMACFGMYLLVRERNDHNHRRGLLPYAATAAAGMGLWWLWAQWYLQLPTDLVGQNAAFNSTLWEQLATRLVNVVNALAPLSLTALPTMHSLVQASFLGVAGGCGVLLLPQAILGVWYCARRWPLEALLMVAGPVMLLIGVFSNAAVPGVHGLQVMSVVLLVLSLLWMQNGGRRRLMLWSVGGQLVLNLLLLLHRGFALVHG